MDFEQVLVNIFGISPLNYDFSTQTAVATEKQLEDIVKWLESKLNSFRDIPVNDEGRIGNSKRVVFEVNSAELNNVSIKISKDKLSLHSQSPFSTLKSNCCVYSGKWIYEVQLKSKGVMQIGWCTQSCKFTQDTGVGDTKNSYGLDGSKQRLWHGFTKKYGPYWRSGDIFGVCVDMDAGTIEYHRNGKALGEAFNTIERGPGLALYPAVSLAFNDGLTANFGGSPLKYPVENYRPLQQPPYKALYQADILLEYLVNIARLTSSSEFGLLSSNSFHIAISSNTFYMLIASILVEKIAPLLINSYVVEEKIVKLIKSLCVLKSNMRSDTLIQPGEENSTLGSFLNLLWTNMENDEMKLFLKLLLNYLLNTFKETPTDLEYEKQRTIIVILTSICNHRQTRKYFLEFKFFKKNCLPLFLYIKPPDETTLEQLLPDENVWTEGLGGSKQTYLETCEKLKSYTTILYSLQKKLVLTLLNNVDGDQDTPSSRKIFMVRFRGFIMENLSVSYNNPTQPAIGLSSLCLILDVAKSMHDDEIKNAGFAKMFKYLDVDHRYFYDGALVYSNVDRVGGVVSHLNKLYSEELKNTLGDEHSSSRAMDSTHTTLFRDIYSTMFLVSHNPGTNSYSLVRNVLSDITTHEPLIPPGNVEHHYSICELIDCSVLFFQHVAYKYIVMIADLRDNITHLSNILLETKKCCDDVLKNMEDLNSCAENGFSSSHDEILKELNESFGQRKNIFAKRSIELARKQAWYRSVALGSNRRNLLCWLMGCVFETLQQASAIGPLFSFVPETYITILPLLLDTIMDFSFHDTGVQHNLCDNKDLIDAAADFLSVHLADQRVIIASCKDALIQALGTLTCHESGIKSLENSPDRSQQLLVKALLRPYENRAWGQSNWLLLRFWLGEGFAYFNAHPVCIFQGINQTLLRPRGLHRSRQKNSTGLLHLVAPAFPSKYFQKIISQMLNEDEAYSTAFLNSLLSQLNWAFSEFIHILQDIQNQSQRDEPRIPDPKQLKICAMCFDLTISLMRALEMIITIAPTVFKDSSRSDSDILLNRILQLVIQVLSRVTVPPSCFQYVIDLCLPDLTGVTHFSIITASLGIILALMQDELDIDARALKLPKVSRYILTDNSFHIACLEFVLGDIKSTISPKSNQPRGNFDPKMRAHIDPLTNEIRQPSPHRLLTGKAILPDPPIIKFSILDYMTHVTEIEVVKVQNLIKTLQIRQSLLSETTLSSEDALCPICYAKPNSAVFKPCDHQSCQNCIIQHLMNSKTCFYCKTFIVAVIKVDGTLIYENKYPPPLFTLIEPTTSNNIPAPRDVLD